MTWQIFDTLLPIVISGAFIWSILATLWLLLRVAASRFSVFLVGAAGMVTLASIVDAMLGEIFIPNAPDVQFIVMLAACMPVPVGLTVVAMKLRKIDLKGANLKQVFE